MGYIVNTNKAWMVLILKVGIVPNLSKDIDLKLTRDIINWFDNKNVDILLEEDIAHRISREKSGVTRDQLFGESSIIVVLGGDGTFLNVARQASKYDVPIFGINLGHLGFLAEAEISDVYTALEKVVSGDYKIEKRMMLEATVENRHSKTEEFVALNDIGITRGPFSRIITYSIFINNNFVDIYSADGIVVCSPTGSTAYSLSAGGPIVSPDVDVLIVTPICPHTLHSRSIVVSSNDTVKVEICDNNTEVMLTVDGQLGHRICPGDIITIKKSPCITNLARMNQRGFFDVLRRKMSERWNYKNI